EGDLPAVGTLHLVDPESGRQLEVRATPKLRERYREAAAERDLLRRTAVHGAGAGHVLLRTDRDWLPELAHHLSTRRDASRRHLATHQAVRRPTLVPVSGAPRA